MQSLIYAQFLIVPILGALRDYTKYKKFIFTKFIRTPIITFFFYVMNRYFIKNPIIAISLSINMERWFFLLIKTIVSCYNDDYNKKREKYIKKYNLKYY